MTCSALKQAYRDALVKDLPAGACHFVLLDVPKAILQDRMAHRPGHFMNPALLESQLETLELPSDALRVDATEGPATVARNILSQLGQA
jgi:gluconokinase